MDFDTNIDADMDLSTEDESTALATTLIVTAAFTVGAAVGSYVTSWWMTPTEEQVRAILEKLAAETTETDPTEIAA